MVTEAELEDRANRNTTGGLGVDSYSGQDAEHPVSNGRAPETVQPIRTAVRQRRLCFIAPPNSHAAAVQWEHQIA